MPSFFSGVSTKLQKWRKKVAQEVVPLPPTNEVLGGEDYVELLMKLKAGCRSGFVPIAVGRIDDDNIVQAAEKFLVMAELLRQTCMEDLLLESKQQFDYIYADVLRIPCDADDFRRIVQNAGFDNMIFFTGYAT